MIIELTGGLWMFPVGITIAGILFSIIHKPTDAWDIGGSLITFGWLIGIIVAWIMWGLSWLM